MDSGDQSEDTSSKEDKSSQEETLAENINAEPVSTSETDNRIPDTSQLNEDKVPKPDTNPCGSETSAAKSGTDTCSVTDPSYENGKIAGLQEAILAIMAKNGPITEQMRCDVQNQTDHDSLINWIKSFH